MYSKMILQIQIIREELVKVYFISKKLNKIINNNINNYKYNNNNNNKYNNNNNKYNNNNNKTN